MKTYEIRFVQTTSVHPACNYNYEYSETTKVVMITAKDFSEALAKLKLAGHPQDKIISVQRHWAEVIQ